MTTDVHAPDIPLLLFYQEPDPDRWLPWDRYPRRAIRRLVRGPARPGGQTFVFLNLCAGLDRLGVPYRVNDFRAARREPDRPVGIIGKPHVLDVIAWRNPILFGASVMSHPLADPTLLQRRPIRRILVPGPWMREMCAPYWGPLVHSWPVGIDTDRWSPAPKRAAGLDILLYDKVHWEYDRYRRELLDPLEACLARHGLRVARLRYGHYRQEEYATLLQHCRAMIFVGEHETQGLAYQQALACGVPVLAWNRGGDWQDPEYYPDSVRFGPVSSVPYWDERCGATFATASDFPAAFDDFWRRVRADHYAPRDYVLEHLTLSLCATHYLEHWRATFAPRDASQLRDGPN